VCFGVGSDQDRQRGPVIPIQQNQWPGGVPVMPMGVIFFDQHSQRRAAAAGGCLRGAGLAGKWDPLVAVSSSVPLASPVDPCADHVAPAIRCPAASQHVGRDHHPRRVRSNGLSGPSIWACLSLLAAPKRMAIASAIFTTDPARPFFRSLVGHHRGAHKQRRKWGQPRPASRKACGKRAQRSGRA
jgi:hypothetical protein